MRKSLLVTMTIAAVIAVLGMGGSAIGQTGPVAKQCAKDIQTFCAGKEHGNRQTRSCLEASRAKLSAECQKALDTTGGGRRTR